MKLEVNLPSTTEVGLGKVLRVVISTAYIMLLYTHPQLI